MEQSFSIPTDTNNRIYGVLHTPERETESILILVHGLAGDMNEYLHLSVAREFTRRGIAVLRFNQYSTKAAFPGARSLFESTITDHVEDTRRIIDYASQCGFTTVALAGHSLGGPVAIAAAATRDIAGLLLWDPTNTPSERVKDWGAYDQTHDIWYLDWSMRILLSRPWLDDAQAFPNAYTTFSTLDVATKIIGAERGLLDFCRRYRAARECEYAEIPNTGHTFSDEGAIEQLMNESWQFLSERRIV
jgi:pimeloyl-ACP methyl ester carboxylesterase